MDRKQNLGYVFISYSANEEKVIQDLMDELRKEGVPLWTDESSNEPAPSLSELLKTVREAAVVFICMSETYKQDPHCRLEADYVFQMQKHYIPLIVQKRYRPDGWLGRILGTKDYYDLSEKQSFESNCKQIKEKMIEMGRLPALARKCKKKGFPKENRLHQTNINDQPSATTAGAATAATTTTTSNDNDN